MSKIIHYIIEDERPNELTTGNKRKLIDQIASEYGITTQEAEMKLLNATEKKPLRMNNYDCIVWTERER